MGKYEGHTPGPWEITTYTNYEGWSIHAPGDGCIAERWYPSHMDEAFNERMHANVALIADAPKLARENKKLSAENRRLREALLDISRQHLESEIPEDERDHGDYRDAYECMVRIARGALASAEPEVCRCRWSEDEAAWVHDCGMRWYLLNDSPTKAIGANYCPKCGKPLEVVNEEDPGT